MGVWYTIKDGDVARRESDNAIVGSSLGLNRGFYNMTRRFGFSEVEAVTSLSKNPARICGIGDHTGTLLPGFDADIAQLAPDHLTVRQCFVRGVCKYQS
jgi:N-acetylglucosamine-6-phosphate deacetylase